MKTRQISGIALAGIIAFGAIIGGVSVNYADTYAANGDVAIDETNFPDDTFRYYISRFDTNKDKFLSSDEIKACTVIGYGPGKYYNSYTSRYGSSSGMTHAGHSVHSLKGLEYFTFLEELYLDNDLEGISSLDLSNNVSLKKLYCFNNNLDSINISKNTMLEEILCNRNNLKTLNVQNNTKLKFVDCSSNSLNNLDISKNTELTQLICSYNNISKLNISRSTNLEKIICDNNNLSKLDTKNNKKIIRIYCENNKITELDISNNKELKSLSCGNNCLVSLDALKGREISKLDELQISGGNQYREVSTVNGELSLSALDPNLDPKRILNNAGKRVVDGYSLMNGIQIGGMYYEDSYKATELSDSKFVNIVGDIITYNYEIYEPDNYYRPGLHVYLKIVSDIKPVAVTSVKLNQTSANITTGNTLKLTATISPSDATNKSVTWSSSNTSVATVTDGNVKALAPGTTDITVKTADGSKTAVCKVTVAVDNNKDKPVSTHTFSDVTNPHEWYYKPVYWAAEKGITTGSNGKFYPADNCTREQAITFLWRMAGRSEPGSMNSKFRDVTNKSSYSYKAIMWGSEKGVITGTDGKFYPTGTCTREQIVTMIWRLAGKPEPKNMDSKFRDVTNKRSYSYKAIMWAQEKGITTGTNGLFYPKGLCKRREIVAFLYRYSNLKQN